MSHREAAAVMVDPQSSQRYGRGYWMVDQCGKPKSGPFGNYETARIEAERVSRHRIGDLPSNYIRYGTKDEVTFP